MYSDTKLRIIPVSVKEINILDMPKENIGYTKGRRNQCNSIFSS